MSVFTSLGYEHSFTNKPSRGRYDFRSSPKNCAPHRFLWINLQKRAWTNGEGAVDKARGALALNSTRSARRNWLLPKASQRPISEPHSHRYSSKGGKFAGATPSLLRVSLPMLALRKLIPDQVMARGRESSPNKVKTLSAVSRDFSSAFGSRGS